MNNKPLRHALISLMFIAISVVWAQVPQPKPKDVSVHPPAAATETSPPASLQETPQLTPDDLAAFLDGMLPAGMAIGDIAGAVVVVVQDDEVLVSRGYGFADMASRRPVSPERTLFRPGSISKLFAWTAVMQQVEAGRLDLDRDINDYLDFRIAGYGGSPIKLRHLMTHTPGFEERNKDLLLDDPRKMKPLEAVLKEVIPASIFPPGKIPAYSNYGAALAGYIVQRVTGLPFEDYVEQRIFRPLRMSNATFRQPVPRSLSAQLSQGYRKASGKVVSFEFCPDVPAGALSASGVDMAQFMLAHLNDGLIPGRGESSRILQPQTVKLMHSVANRPAPFIDAMALGFYEQNRNDVRAIAHGGDLIAFHSDLILIPAARVGLFVSFNSVGKDNMTYNLRTALVEEFMDRYFPRRSAQPSMTLPDVVGAQTRAAVGSYELSRRSETNLFSLIYMLGQTRASSPSQGVLQIDDLTGLNNKPKQFREVAPWLWQEEAGEARLAAVRAANGTIEYLAPDGYGPIFVFQPVPGYRDKRWLLPALGSAAAILSISVLSWLIGAVRRRWRPAGSLAPIAAQNRRSRWISRMASLGSLVFLVLAGVMVVLAAGDSLWIFSSAATPLLRLVQLSGLLAVVAAIAAVAASVLSWRTAGEHWRNSTGRMLIALACLVCAYVVVVFHFLSLQLQY